YIAVRPQLSVQQSDPAQPRGQRAFDARGLCHSVGLTGWNEGPCEFSGIVKRVLELRRIPAKQIAPNAVGARPTAHGFVGGGIQRDSVVVSLWKPKEVHDVSKHLLTSTFEQGNDTSELPAPDSIHPCGQNERSRPGNSPSSGQ